MTRDSTLYANMGAAKAFAGQDVSKPEAGFFRFRLSGKSVAVGVEIRFGPPLDPITGEELDRSWRWLAFVNGEAFGDFDRIWPACVSEPITEAEYRTYCARQDWARTHAPESSYAEPGRRHERLLFKPSPVDLFDLAQARAGKAARPVS